MNTSCVFPFIYEGKTYNECAHDEDGFWCSTLVDEFRGHVTDGGNWGTCGAECPMPGK